MEKILFFICFKRPLNFMKEEKKIHLMGCFDASIQHIIPLNQGQVAETR